MNGRRVSIQERLKRYFSLMSVIPALILSIAMTAYVTFNVYNRSREMLSGNVERAQAELNQLLEEAYQVGRSVEEDGEIRNALEETYASEQERRMAELTVNNELSYISRYFDARIEVYIIAENGMLVKNGRFSFLDEDFRQNDWYQAVMQDNEATWFPLSVYSRVVRSVEGSYATLGIPLRTKGDARKLGVLLVEVQVADVLRDMERSGSHFYIIAPDLEMRIVDERVEQYENDVITLLDDRDIQTLYREDDKPNYVENTVGSITYWREDFEPVALRNAGGYVLSYSVVDTNQWILVNCVSYMELYGVPILVCGLSLLGIALLTVIMLWASDRTAHAVTNPIKRLNESVHMVGDGNFDLDIRKTHDDEIGDLSDQFARMVRKIRELMARVIEEQRIQRKYELLLLQAQINPHFLYNSLDSIVWLVRMRKNDDAEIMLSALTQFFKTGLNRGNDTLSLAQEIRNVQSYMTIQTYRYRSKLSFETDLDERAMDLEVPKLILQPLVENAIYHGVKEKDGPGKVALRCREEAGQVVIEISDDGPGMDACQLERLNAQLRDDDVRSRSSYGILNVQERLRLFFHENCVMTIKSTQNVGTCVTIRIRVEGERNAEPDNR